MNNSSQLRQGQKIIGLLTGEWRSLEGYNTLKSHENMVENHCELCSKKDYVILDIDLRILDID